MRSALARNQEETEDYISRLLWWNKKINLVSREVSRETLYKHVEHSLTILISGLFNSASFVIDSGTGGGLPGIPLAIASPEKKIFLNDVVSKKITACKQIALSLGLKNITGVAESIEKIETKEGCVIISKHAFKINQLMDMIGDKPWKGVVLLKGKNEVDAELGGIEDDLNIEIRDLYPGFSHSFYEGKALVEITKK